jgi:hypothetical protein
VLITPELGVATKGTDVGAGHDAQEFVVTTT